MHSLLLEGSFRLFGLNPFGLRFLAMLSGTPIVGYTYVMMRVARFSVTPILASAFVLATSWTMTGFSKCMTLEPTLLHFYALSLLLAFVAESRLRGASMVYWSSCVAMGLGTLCKTSGVPMALACLPFLLFGVVVGRQRMLWRWRIAGTSAYSLGFAMTVAAGFWRWILPDLDSFYTLTVRTAFLERAQNPLFMRLYKAIFWLDSQAFLTTPFWLCALVLLFPTLNWAVRTTWSRTASMRRFAVGLSLSSGLIGLLMMINVDVSARRLVYISISLALLTGALWDALWRTRDHIWSSRKAILTWALLAHAMFYLVAVGLWMGRISHTGENASRAPGSIVPPGAYVLGADAAAQGYFNETRPIFWSPKNYLFANHDESAIQRDYNPEYMVLNAIDLQKLRQGKYSCGPFVKSFLDHEVARLPIYEYHESLTLGTDLIVLRRAP